MFWQGIAVFNIRSIFTGEGQSIWTAMPLWSYHWILLLSFEYFVDWKSTCTFFACFFWLLMLLPCTIFLLLLQWPIFLCHFFNIFFPSWKQLALLLWHVILECCFSIWKEAWIWKPHGCKQVLNKQNKILGLCSLAHCTKTIWERNRCVSRAQIKCRWT